jgi:hypothetical protein
MVEGGGVGGQGRKKVEVPECRSEAVAGTLEIFFMCCCRTAKRGVGTFFANTFPYLRI